MSENAETPVKTRKSYGKILLLVLAILILLLVYGAGILILSFSAHLSFQNKNCDLGLTLHKVYASLYPEFIRDASLTGPVRECEAYGLAASSEKDENWRGAYDAYQDYLSAYPNGLYAEEAQEHSAIVLVSITKEQLEQKKYEEAAKNLDLLVSTYLDTSVSSEVWTLLASDYISWGTDLRDAGDFEKSEQVLNDFRTVSQTYQKADLTMDAQHELAKTYVAWGLDLQSQKQFEEALVKFDLAVSADPQAQFESGAQAKSGQRKVYIDWGNDLLEQKQFQAAIEKFDLAVARAEADKDDGARAASINGRIQWASDLSAAEDFTGALEQLGFAREAATTDPLKETVNTALEETYVAFSASTGKQAQRAIKEVLKTVCKEHEAPALPIFGLNKDSIRVGLYGVEDQLPANLVAKTPGEMHYIACITPDNSTVQSQLHNQIVLKVSKGYYYTVVEQFRVRVIWNVNLVKADTGKSIGERTFTGGDPPPFSDVGGNFFYGKPPIDEFLSWLRSVIP